MRMRSSNGRRRFRRSSDFREENYTRHLSTLNITYNHMHKTMITYNIRNSNKTRSPEFREEFVVLERRLLDLLSQPRIVLGQSLTGGTLAEMLGQWLTAIDQRSGILGDICQMPTQLELLRDMAVGRAIEAGLRRYREVMREVGLIGPAARLPVAPAALLADHEAARLAAVGALEAASGGLDEPCVAAGRATMEAQLADWRPQVHVLPSAAGRAGDEDEDVVRGSDFCRAAPTVLQVRGLGGGLLRDIWQENARRSQGAYSAWLKQLSSLKQEAQGKAPGGAHEPRPAEPLGAFYQGVHQALSQLGADAALGPWARPQAEGGVMAEIVTMMQQGDELVSETVAAEVRSASESGQRRLEERSRELQEEAGAAAAGLRQGLQEGLDGIAQRLEQLDERASRSSSELREALALAQERSGSRADDLAEALSESSRRQAERLAEAVQESSRLQAERLAEAVQESSRRQAEELAAAVQDLSARLAEVQQSVADVEGRQASALSGACEQASAAQESRLAPLEAAREAQGQRLAQLEKE